jgi:hypothetical protein
MKIADLKEGDRLEDHRRGAVLVIKQIVFCGSCPCGWGEISYEETSKNAHVSHVHSPRKCCKTFRQFERLRSTTVCDHWAKAIPNSCRTAAESIHNRRVCV